jgi:hypothetical protein
MAIDTQVAALLRQHKAAIDGMRGTINQMAQAMNVQQAKPQSVQEEIDSIEGRRIEGVIAGEVTFTAADVGQRAQPIVIQVSQDGPFVMTHYPLVLWRPSAPDNTTNLQRWRPITTFPLPTQVVSTDIIDIMYELNDGGAQRLGQNQPRAPLLSRPDNMVPCPIPTLWSPNAAIVFQPTYLSLTWNSATPPTQGILHCSLIGYRIVNM